MERQVTEPASAASRQSTLEEEVCRQPHIFRRTKSSTLDDSQKARTPSPKVSPSSPKRRSLMWLPSRLQRSKPPQHRSSYFISDEMKGRIRSQNKYALQGEWLMYWDILLFALLIYTGLSEPVILVFELRGTFLWLSGVAISTVYMSDTIINFFRAQKVPTREGVALVTDIGVLAKNYLFGMFAVDLLSGLPMSFFAGDKWRRIQLLRMLRFIHTWRLIQNIQKLTSWSYSVLNTCQFIVILVFVIHWIACAWCFMERSDDETTWLTELKTTLKAGGSEADFESMADEYLLSLYWSVTVISSVGFGDITPKTNQEILMAQVCMAIGGGVWAYIVGSMCSIVFSLDRQRHTFENLMNDVNVICKERHLPRDLQERVRDFFRHARDFMRMREYHNTVHELSPALKGEVIKCMYGSHFSRVWYFDVVDDYTALLLVENLIPKMYARDEWIEASVGSCRALVFLRSGVCVRKANVLAPGAVWGLDVILSSEEHEDIEELLDTATAKSVTFAVVLKLSKHGIDHAARLVPSFANRLRKAHLRMLLWRGVIAASRAAKKIRKPEGQVKPSRWDKLGQTLAKVVHHDRQLLDPTNPLWMSANSERRLSKEALQENENLSRPPTPRALDAPDPSLATDHPTQSSKVSRKLSLVKDTMDRQVSSSSFQVSNGSCNSRPPTPRDVSVSQDESCRPRRRSVQMLPLPHLRVAEQAPDPSTSKADVDKCNELEDASPQSWKAKIERQIRCSDEAITTLHEELSEEICTISEEVTELTRLMHQVLSRLDAEENY